MVDEVAGSGSAASAAQAAGSRQISQLSRAKAANGEGTLSAETQRAIANGAQAPTITQPKSTSSAGRDDGVVTNISDEAQQLASTGTVDGVGGGLTAAAEGIPTPAAGAVLSVLV